MIIVNIVRDKKRYIWEFTVKGHSGFSELGTDIVCAAVSILTQTAIAGLQELAGIKKYSKRNGSLKCNIPLDIKEDDKYRAGIILDTMVIGLKQIAKSYKKFVVVIDEEV